MNRKDKSLLVILLTIALLMIIKGATAEAYVGSIFSYTYEGQTITYQVLSEPTVTENGTAQIIYSNEVNKNLVGEITIPSSVTNQKMIYNVIKVNSDSFAEAKGITSVKLPDTIEVVGEYSFYNCSSLTSINIPNAVTRIEKNTFYGCSSLSNINLPDRLSYIGSYAFYNCNKLTGIDLVKGITYLGASAFEGCSSITSIQIPEGVTSIEDKLFQDCINLSSVSLPEGINKIGKRAFYNCSSLSQINIPDDVTSIGEYAFYLCTSLTSIKIPYGVTKLEDYTFLGCSSLTNIRIQDKITSIGDFTFFGCTNLISINLPEGLVSIGKWAFYNCESIRPIKIPSSVTSIGVGEFPYSGVFVYKNSYAESYFKLNQPKYYQIINLPLEEMSFAENVMNMEVNDTLQLKTIFYPVFSTEITDISWTSSNQAVALVDTNGVVKGLQAGEADITAVMGKYSVSCHIIVDGIVVNPTSIEFINNNVNMNKGTSAKLQLKFTPVNSTNQKITWASSNPSVVSVEEGRIYAKNSGTATITAISGTTSTECKVTVSNPITEIFSDYDHITLEKGDTKRIAISFVPMDTTQDKTTIWRSEDEAVATVVNGVIKTLKPGTTTITATVGTLTHSIPLTVHIPIKSFTMTQKELGLIVGQTQLLPLEILPIDTSDNIIISSSDESIATYSAGTITALKRGTTTITAICGSFTVTCFVTVDTDIESITLDKKNLNLYLGSSGTLMPSYLPTNAKDDRTITWESSDKSVVTVDSNGTIRTMGIGTATITATAGGSKIVTSTVVVKLATPSTLKKVLGDHDYVKLSWGKVSGASGYQIYRATSKTGSYTKIKATTASSLTNTGLTTGSYYYYKVRAYRYQGTKKVYSSFTKVYSTRPIPSTPSNVKLVKPKSGMIKFTWDKVSGASGYEIYRTSSKSEPYKLIKSNTSLHFINYGLTKGKTYYYKVRAYKLVGKKKVYSKFSVSLSMKM